jgi:hypothetical protein
MPVYDCSGLRGFDFGVVGRRVACLSACAKIEDSAQPLHRVAGADVVAKF